MNTENPNTQNFKKGKKATNSATGASEKFEWENSHCFFWAQKRAKFIRAENIRAGLPGR